MPPAIAVIGAGPSGFYAIDALFRALPAARIDLVERLPAPFGLVRFGVAADHQGTKAVTRQFDRLLARPELRFLGGVEVGRDVSLAELRAAYGAVVVATGCPRDRRLGVPGEGLEGVVGSAAFALWCNGHPDAPDLSPLVARARAVAVIGHGNVAIDVARVLAKTASEMAKSDLAPPAAAAIAAAPLKTVALFGRRGPAEASFTPAELAELGRLERAAARVEGAAIPGEVPDRIQGADRVRVAKNLESFRGFAAAPSTAKPVDLAIVFGATPAAFHGAGRLTEAEFARAGGEGMGRRFACDLAVTCIGYDAVPPMGLPVESGRIANRDGRVVDLPGVYAVGWARRGPSGTIPTNRADSIAVAERIVADLAAAPADGPAKPGGAALDELLAARGVQPIDAAGWRRIDAAESAAGQAAGRPRVKLASWAALRAAAAG